MNALLLLDERRLSSGLQSQPPAYVDRRLAKFAGLIQRLHQNRKRRCCPQYYVPYCFCMINPEISPEFPRKRLHSLILPVAIHPQMLNLSIPRRKDQPPQHGRANSAISEFRFDTECDIGRQIVIWRMEFSRSTKVVVLKNAEDEALAGETLCGIANEIFIFHTAHEAIAATGGIQPQQVIAKERLFSREKLSDSPGSHGRRLVHVGWMNLREYLCGSEPSSAKLVR